MQHFLQRSSQFSFSFVGKELLFLTFVACVSLKHVVWQLWGIKCFVTKARVDGTAVLKSPSCLLKEGVCLKKSFAYWIHLSSVEWSLLMVAVTCFEEVKKNSRWMKIQWHEQISCKCLSWGLFSFTEDLGYFYSHVCVTCFLPSTCYLRLMNMAVKSNPVITLTALTMFLFFKHLLKQLQLLLQ